VGCGEPPPSPRLLPEDPGVVPLPDPVFDPDPDPEPDPDPDPDPEPEPEPEPEPDELCPTTLVVVVSDPHASTRSMLPASRPATRDAKRGMDRTTVKSPTCEGCVAAVENMRTLTLRCRVDGTRCVANAG
jgi:hypothetical protein